MAIFMAVVLVVALAAAGVWYLLNDSEEKTLPDPQSPNSVLETINLENEQAREEGEEEQVISIIFPDRVRRHSSREDCWVVFDKEVYDISQWEYPGETSLDDVCGTLDAPEIFAQDGQPKPPRDYFVGRYVVNIDEVTIVKPEDEE